MNRSQKPINSKVSTTILSPGGGKSTYLDNTTDKKFSDLAGETGITNETILRVHYPEQPLKESREVALGDISEFARCFDENRIYLSDDLCGKLEGLYKEFSEIATVFQNMASVPPDIFPSPELTVEHWVAVDKVKRKIPSMRQDIETEFRVLLGVMDKSALVQISGK